MKNEEILFNLQQKAGFPRPVWIQTNKDGQLRGIQVRLNSSDDDVSDIDIFSEIPKNIDGFCNCLSSLPKGIWPSEGYEVSDIIRKEGDWAEATRSFPKVLQFQGQPLDSEGALAF